MSSRSFGQIFSLRGNLDSHRAVRQPFSLLMKPASSLGIYRGRTLEALRGLCIEAFMLLEHGLEAIQSLRVGS